uniref:Uncharacterized protein n=1 Tax=Micrurus paraensis TaxID=1970185 RepID=A0A2D4L3Q6_9SAUR
MMGSIPFWGSQDHLQNYVSVACERMSKWGAVLFISKVIMFNKEGAITKKALLLGPAKWILLGEHSLITCYGGSVDYNHFTQLIQFRTRQCKLKITNIKGIHKHLNNPKLTRQQFPFPY